MTEQEIAQHIAPLIGRAYRHDFRCWDLVRHVSLTIFRRPLPATPADIESSLQIARAFRTHPERARWRRTLSPRSGAIVLIGAATRETHAGIYIDIDGGAVLHTEERTGVVFESLTDLTERAHTVNFYEVAS